MTGLDTGEAPDPVPGVRADGDGPDGRMHDIAPSLRKDPPQIPEDAMDVRIHFDRTSLWRAGWILVVVVALAAFGRWVLDDAGTVIFTLVMSLLASIAMEPAVSRLGRSMRRGLATGIVMLGVLLFSIVFLISFGRLLGEQLATFAKSIPQLIADLTAWANERFGLKLDYTTLVETFGVTSSTIANAAQGLAGGLIGVIGAIVSTAGSLLTFSFFTFYFSADGPRLRRWVARLVPPRRQQVFVVAWDLAVAKTGGYISARLVLATICGSLAAVFMLIIGMDYWLALGIWTGLVAQFVPTIGTYIAIALPVVIGLIGDEPWQGLAVLAFALVYQQVENVTLEPRISAEAVDMHPAVSFGAVMFGAALFGVAGAFVAVPMAALMLALFEIYSNKYELLPHIAEPQPGEARWREDGDDPDGPGGAPREPVRRARRMTIPRPTGRRRHTPA
ncbi:membrane protein [Intrasporangium oryzae NRRL B-24470]|uniref:Membrane protein n=1 Tax=Intrasporangium oryzae NRRL B-24470 TaxID=1386089 RepID=W9GCQ6_9MICO|nr:AI-2E family transporter [Intrasporangium oryzae]EWT02987.1 membrane protein [Intrasporangium oryzae NRRL B-24470]